MEGRSEPNRTLYDADRDRRGSPVARADADLDEPCRLARYPHAAGTRRQRAAPEWNAALRQHKLQPPAPVLKAILSALSERDETAEICTDEKGNPEADPELRDTENVPLGEDVQEFFDREVEPHVPDAWINIGVKDPQDGKIGRVGYEINFNRYFYKYQPPRPLEEIEADIRTLEREIQGMFKGMMT